MWREEIKRETKRTKEMKENRDYPFHQYCKDENDSVHHDEL